MPSAVLVADIGSTFTKGRAYDASGELVWSGQLPTRSGELDVTESQLRERVAGAGVDLADGPILACSSAAGGLRIVALGLTQTFTRKAARTAALGAGGRLVGDYSLLDHEALASLMAEEPDVVLLTGGSDSGDAAQAVDLARGLAQLQHPLSVVVACNRAVAARCAEIVEQAGHTAEVVPNVMPEVGQLNVEAARAAIRRIFLDRVIGRLAEHETHGFEVCMPTPSAVRDATMLISTMAVAGVVVLDVGGATTDVHSVAALGQIARHSPSSDMAERTVRTVEADLGMRESACATYDAAGRAGLLDTGADDRPPEGLEAAVKRRTLERSIIDEADLVDEWLAGVCVRVGLERHVGRLVLAPTASGAIEPVPIGRDLREARTVVATGGVLSRADPATVTSAVTGPADLLLPRNAAVVIDHTYELAALGVLHATDPLRAMRVARRMVAAWPSASRDGAARD